MNQYLIPANSKKGQLLFNLFRPTDLVLLLVGAVISLFLMIGLSGDTLPIMVLKLLPIGICVLLVMPVAQYHNVLVFLQEMFIYLFNQKEYHWKGWCAFNVFDEQRKK